MHTSPLLWDHVLPNYVYLLPQLKSGLLISRIQNEIAKIKYLFSEIL